MIVGVDSIPSVGARAQVRLTLVNPKTLQGDLVPYLVELTKGAGINSFDASAMSMDRGLSAIAWAKLIIASRRAGIKTRPFQLVTGRVWKGYFCSAPAAPRCRRSGLYMEKKINIDDLITMIDQKIGFDLMHRRKHRSVVVLASTLAGWPPQAP